MPDALKNGAGPLSVLLVVFVLTPCLRAQDLNHLLTQTYLQSASTPSSTGSAPAGKPSLDQEGERNDEQPKRAGATPSEDHYYPRSIFVYGGTWSDNDFGDILLGKTAPRDSHVWAFGMSRTVYEYNRNLLFELELNVAKHTGEQHHWAFNSAFSARWMRFPWDEHVNSTLSFGLGPSYALDRPEIENEPDEDTARFLIFMVTEATFGLPGKRGSRWETFVRIHHRSGGFGLIKESIGSNFITVGLRYRFGQ